MNNFTLKCATVAAALWMTQAAAAGDAGSSLTGSLNKPAQAAAATGIAGTSPGSSLNNPARAPAAGAASRSMTPQNAHPAIVGDSAAAAQLAGAVGYRVYAQAWNPLKPGQDTPTQVANQPAGISKAMNSLWDAARTFITDPRNPDSVPSLLGKKDLITKGMTLYDIKFTVNPLSAIDLQQGASVVYAGQGGSGPRPQAPRPNEITLHWKIPGTRLEFKATTPDVVKGVGAPRLLDPDLSAQIDLDITLGLAVSETPGQPYLQVTQVQVFAQQTKIDSGNLSGDVLVGLTNFLSNTLYGKSFNALLDQIFNDRNLAADPQHGGFAFGGVKTFDMQQMANDYLRPVNDAITASGVANYVRTGVWVKQQATGRMLTLLFAPKSLPLPPLKGSMAGLVTFDATVSANRLPASCDGLVSGDRLDVSIQTGPRKVLDVDPFRYGDAPMQRLTNVAFSGKPQQNRQCAYMLSGLALGYPNNVAFPPPALGSNGSLGNIAQYLEIDPQGWTSPVSPAVAASGPNGVFPQVIPNGNVAPLANYNLVAKMSYAANTGVGAAQVNPMGLANRPTNPGSPSEKFGTQNEQTAAQRAGQPAPSALAAKGVQRASAGPNWGAPGTPAGTAPVSAANIHNPSQPAQRAGQPAATPSSLGASEQRP